MTTQSKCSTSAFVGGAMAYSGFTNLVSSVMNTAGKENLLAVTYSSLVFSCLSIVIGIGLFKGNAIAFRFARFYLGLSFLCLSIGLLVVIYCEPHLLSISPSEFKPIDRLFYETMPEAFGVLALLIFLGKRTPSSLADEESVQPDHST